MDKYAHGFVVLCFVVVMQSFIMNSYEVFIHIHQGCFAGTGAIVRLPQCKWSKPDGYGKISQCITTTKHSKAKTVCICLGIYCIYNFWFNVIGVPFTKINLKNIISIWCHDIYRKMENLCEQRATFHLWRPFLAFREQLRLEQKYSWHSLLRKLERTVLFGVS